MTQRIDETLDALDGLQRAVPRAGLYNAIAQRLGGRVVRELSPKTVWLAAASFALLVSVNVALVTTYNRVAKQTSVESLANAYQLNPGSDDPYR